MHGWRDFLMYEYVFFHKQLAQKFEAKAKSLGVSTQLNQEELSWEVILPEDISEDVDDKLSDYYDELFDEDQELYEIEHSETEFQGAAIEITLKNGEKTYAETDQKIMGKILSVLTFDELNILINDIATAVENPNDKTLCERRREDEVKSV